MGAKLWLEGLLDERHELVERGVLPALEAQPRAPCPRRLNVLKTRSWRENDRGVSTNRLCGATCTAQGVRLGKLGSKVLPGRFNRDLDWVGDRVSHGVSRRRPRRLAPAADQGDDHKTEETPAPSAKEDGQAKA